MFNYIKVILTFIFFICANFKVYKAHADLIQGVAKDIRTGKILYIEKHDIKKNAEGLNLSIATEYMDSQGKKIGKMNSDFSKDFFLPDIIFEDYRFSVVLSQTLDPKTNKITLIKKTKNEETSRKEFVSEKTLVSGQGFDNYIKQNFIITEEQSIPFNFIVLDKLDFFRFEIISPASSLFGVKEFHLKLRSFLLSLFVNTIKVKYSKSTKLLVNYYGLSNILDDTQNTQEVSIDYEAIK